MKPSKGIASEIIRMIDVRIGLYAGDVPGYIDMAAKSIEEHTREAVEEVLKVAYTSGLDHGSMQFELVDLEKSIAPIRAKMGEK